MGSGLPCDTCYGGEDMKDEEYIELRKKELHMILIKVAEKDKEKAFEILLNVPFAMVGYPDEEYKVSEMALPLLDKEKIEYKLLK